MIVDPEFFRHLKTERLVEMTGNPDSPLAVIRLWAYCHDHRRSEFPNMTPKELERVCAWRIETPKCHHALLKCGFLKRVSRQRGFSVHGWDERNSKLVSSWRNGAKGGRRASSSSRELSTSSENEDTSFEKDSVESGVFEEPNKEFGSIDSIRSDQRGVDKIRSDGMRPRDVTEVVEYAAAITAFDASPFAESWFRKMERSEWVMKDGSGSMQEWRNVFFRYAETASKGRGAA